MLYNFLNAWKVLMSKFLKGKEIPSVAYYSEPLYLWSVFENLGHKEGDFPVAEKCGKLVFELSYEPLFIC